MLPDGIPSARASAQRRNTDLYGPYTRSPHVVSWNVRIAEKRNGNVDSQEFGGDALPLRVMFTRTERAPTRLIEDISTKRSEVRIESNVACHVHSTGSTGSLFRVSAALAGLKTGRTAAESSSPPVGLAARSQQRSMWRRSESITNTTDGRTATPSCCGRLQSGGAADSFVFTSSSLCDGSTNTAELNSASRIRPHTACRYLTQTIQY